MSETRCPVVQTTRTEPVKEKDAPQDPPSTPLKKPPRAKVPRATARKAFKAVSRTPKAPQGENATDEKEVELSLGRRNRGKTSDIAVSVHCCLCPFHNPTLTPPVLPITEPDSRPNIPPPTSKKQKGDVALVLVNTEVCVCMC